MAEDEHAFISPGGLFEALKERAEHQAMHGEQTIMQFNNFLDGLSVEQLVTLRRILNLEGMSATLNFLDGQIYAILRCVRHVNPDTGEAYDAELTQQ